MLNWKFELELFCFHPGSPSFHVGLSVYLVNAVESISQFENVLLGVYVEKSLRLIKLLFCDLKMLWNAKFVYGFRIYNYVTI